MCLLHINIDIVYLTLYTLELLSFRFKHNTDLWAGATLLARTPTRGVTDFPSRDVPYIRASYSSLDLRILFAPSARSPSRLGEQLSSFQRCVSYAGMETAWRTSSLVLCTWDSASGSLLWPWSWSCLDLSLLWARLTLSSSTVPDNGDRVFGHWKLGVENSNLAGIPRTSY